MYVEPAQVNSILADACAARSGRKITLPRCAPEKSKAQPHPAEGVHHRSCAERLGTDLVHSSCQSDVDCPTDFECAGGSCGRKGCAADANCSGYCVNGLCYSTPGTCYGAVA